MRLSLAGRLGTRLRLGSRLRVGGSLLLSLGGSRRRSREHRASACDLGGLGSRGYGYRENCRISRGGRGRGDTSNGDAPNLTKSCEHRRGRLRGRANDHLGSEPSKVILKLSHAWD